LIRIFVSAALKDVSRPATTLRWIDRYGGLLKSTDTEAKLLADLRRPRLAGKIDPVFLNQVRRLLALAEQVNITERIRVSRDPEDDMFLELAVNGQADAIVSGDADLLALDTFREIPIITPAAFGAVAP
jgi:predicted nucleic acid-binding protein